MNAGNGGLDRPIGLLFDADGNLYVSSLDTNEVLRYSTASQAVFTVSLSSPSSLPVTVDFSTADGTAVAGSDYTTVSGTITFAPGMTTRTILVPTIDDAVEESTESLFVNLSAATGAVIQDSLGEATISDDDAVFSVTGVTPDSASPGDQLTVVVTGSGFVDGATVDFGKRVSVQSVTFVSSSQLDVQIKVHRRATAGSRDVTVTNPDNSSGTCSGCFTVTAGLLAETTGDGGNVILLTQADAEAFTAYALQLWADATGVTPTAALQVTVADLPGNQLGSTNGHTITLDVDAAGIGWFIDATPGDNVEFDPALGNTAALNQYDLLAAAVHEVGHALGYEHSDGVMADTLGVGERRLPMFDADPMVPLAADETEPVFHINMQDSTPVVNDPDNEKTPILTQPVYAETNDYDFNGDAPENDAAESTDDTPLAILPDDEYDGLFTNLDGSLLDELLAV